jgi:hypothetical protein
MIWLSHGHELPTMQPARQPPEDEPIYVETDGIGDEVFIVTEDPRCKPEVLPVRPRRVTEEELVVFYVPCGPQRASPDMYATDSYDDLASLASARAPDATLGDAYEQYVRARDASPRPPPTTAQCVSARDAPPRPPPTHAQYVSARDAPRRRPTPEPTTFAAGTRPPPGLRVHARRPLKCATPLDVFLRLRGLEDHADVLYVLGARKLGDLRYLRKEDYSGVGLDLGDLNVKVQF